MSKISTPPVQQTSKATASIPPTVSSAWSRGPPAPSADSPQQLAEGGKPNGNGVFPQGNGNGVGAAQSSGAGPVPIGGGHSRKGSLMVGGGVDIKKGRPLCVRR
jgi:hypothetical protein